ncbi:MAG: hypothetical protein QG656_369 [Candidatus Hydrogenedentes bacterium]|nr:hypothetical protein [Candidatus Hydrogenedentota bacterium]
MALTTTTLSSACAATDTSIVVTSATGFAARSIVLIDQEQFQVANSYTSGTTIPVLRGQGGTSVKAHVSGANVTVGTGSDFANPASQEVVGFPIAGRARTLTSYSAAGAITLPTPGNDAVAVLNGTSVLAMTVAAPTKDMDGSVLTIVGNGAAAHTITFTGGLSGASTSYDVLTVNASAPIATSVMACNGLWISFVQVPMAGTVTNITGTIA